MLKDVPTEYTLGRHWTSGGMKEASTPRTMQKVGGLHFHDLENITITLDMSPAEAEDNFVR